MPQVQVIQPIQQQTKRLRVAAYARVSSKSADQLNSMSVQVEYYTDHIQKNPDWEFAGVYADEGISGTGLKNRAGFNHLMDDCRLGLIDRILVKSSSRMARNSVDFLSAVRELKSLGVVVEFEKECFDTDSTEGDSRLEWQTKGHRWRCRHCAAFSVQIAPDILLQSIATTMKRLQDNPDSINDQPLSHNTVSIEAEKQQAEIDEMLSAGEFDAASLIQSVLSRADTQYLCCTAGNSDPMTLRIKEALAAAPPCDTFNSKLYHTIADKIVLHRTTSIQLKLINGMVV